MAIGRIVVGAGEIRAVEGTRHTLCLTFRGVVSFFHLPRGVYRAGDSVFGLVVRFLRR